jgi:hypothetical protein
VNSAALATTGMRWDLRPWFRAGQSRIVVSMTSRPGQLDLVISDAVVADRSEYRLSGPPDSGGVVDGAVHRPGGALNDLPGEIRSSWTAEEPGQLESVPAGDVSAEMPSAAWAITQELLPLFDGVLSERLVHDHVAQAVSDLAGSISIESLPEMAIRLASVRLRNLLGSGQPTPDTQVL